MIGIPDEPAGEVPKAFVVPSAPLTPEEATAFVAERVAPYKKVRAAEIIEEIPKAPSGKIPPRTRRARAGRDAHRVASVVRRGELVAVRPLAEACRERDLLAPTAGRPNR